MKFQNTNEKDFTEKLKAGDERSFREFYDLHNVKVYNTALGFLVNENDAEDITQEVFVQVFKSIKYFEGKSSLSTWVYRITVTKSLDLLRSRKAKKRFAFIKNVFEKSEDGGREDKDEVFINPEHPGVLEENRELSVILFREIDKLPENQRIAFVLNKTEQLSYQEVSEVMGISLSSAESLIFRAKSNLKKRLEKFFSNEQRFLK
jgi:RNA polymerase sigma-70 factor (ECF subfamily)